MVTGPMFTDNLTWLLTGHILWLPLLGIHPPYMQPLFILFRAKKSINSVPLSTNSISQYQYQVYGTSKPRRNLTCGLQSSKLTKFGVFPIVGGRDLGELVLFVEK